MFAKGAGRYLLGKKEKEKKLPINHTAKKGNQGKSLKLQMARLGN